MTINELFDSSPNQYPVGRRKAWPKNVYVKAASVSGSYGSDIESVSIACNPSKESPGGSTIHRILRLYNRNLQKGAMVLVWIPAVTDIAADDWEVYRES